MSHNDHQRKKIREAVKAILQFNTLVNDRVFVNRYTPLWESELPCICVYTNRDTSVKPRGSSFYRRKLALIIEIIVKPDEKVDDDIDYIAKEVEDLIHADTDIIDPDTEESVASWVEMNETNITIQSEGNKLYGSGRIACEVEYETEIAPTEDGVGDFKSAQVDFETSDTNTTPEARDEIQIP